MKNISKSLLAIAVTGVVFVASCKKGEEDPTLSLRSRKSRVAGEWTVASAEVKSSNTSLSGTNSTNSTGTVSYTGDTYKETSSYTQSTSAGTTTTTETLNGKVTTNTYTFEKDGTWTSTLDYTTTETETDPNAYDWTLGSGSETTTTDKHYVIKRSGVWNFLGKVQDDTKAKEEMTVSTTSEDITVTTTEKVVFTPTTGNTKTTDYTSSSTDVNTYASNEVTEIWKIKQLKNSEMIVTTTGKGTSSDTNSSTSGTTTTSSTSSGTHETTGTMTLTQE